MSVTLDGVPLDVVQPVTWRLTWGTSPNMGAVEVPAETAAALVRDATPYGSTLELDVVTVERLTILGLSPGSHRLTRFVRFADARWAWEKRHVFRRMNVRQRTGNRVRVGNLDAPLAVAQFADEEVYRPWSLEGGLRAFTVRAALRAVLDRVTHEGRWRDDVDPTFGQELVSAVLEEQLYDDPGDAAVARLLSYQGAALGTWCDLDGTVVLAVRLDDRERELVGLPVDGEGTTVRGDEALASPLGPQVFGEPTWALQDRRMERPVKYRVLFDREIELRFDFKESTDGNETVAVPDRPPLKLRNVLPSPDASLQLSTAAGGATILQGTWVTVTDYLTAKVGSWGAPAHVGDAGSLTPRMVRACYLSSGCAELGFFDSTGVNARAIAETLGAYRGTYQIHPAWMKRLAWWRPSLASIVDHKRATPAASPVYQNWAEWLTWRAQVQERAGADPSLALMVRNRYARDDHGSVIAGTIGSMRVSAGRVVPLDQDVGVFSVRFAPDATGQQGQVIPSALEPSTVPSTDPTAAVTSLAAGRLTTDHEVSVVLTVGMGSPNDERALHVVEVEPKEVAGLLGRKDVGPCVGPVVELRVNAAQGIAARFAWQDAQADVIRDAFEENPTAQNLPAALCLNEQDLVAFARAAAAAHLAALLDHPEGTYAGWLAPGAKPLGTASIEHRLAAGPNGGALTSAILPPEPPRVDLVPYLPDAVRKRVLRQLP